MITASAHIISSLQLLVGVGGFGFIAYQLGVSTRQHRVSAQATRSSVYNNVGDAMGRVTSMLDTHIELYPFFYENVELPVEAGLDDFARVKALRTRADLVCEAIMDMVDAVVEQHRTMPDNMDWSTWYAYFRWLYANSPVVRTYVDENVEFYPDYVFAALGRIHVRQGPEGRISHRYQASAFVPGEDGGEGEYLQREVDILRSSRGGTLRSPQDTFYPWVQTWLVEPVPDDAKGDQPSVLIDVSVTWSRKVGMDIATVRWVETASTVPGEDGEAIRGAIRQWLLRMLDRTGIRWVVFKEVAAPATAEAMTFEDLRATPGGFGRRNFDGLGASSRWARLRPLWRRKRSPASAGAGHRRQ